MATKKTADLSGLVATKGQAAPVANVPARSAAPAEDAEVNNVPLNFGQGELITKIPRTNKGVKVNGGFLKRTVIKQVGEVA